MDAFIITYKNVKWVSKIQEHSQTRNLHLDKTAAIKRSSKQDSPSNNSYPETRKQRDWIAVCSGAQAGTYPGPEAPLTKAGGLSPTKRVHRHGCCCCPERGVSHQNGADVLTLTQGHPAWHPLVNKGPRRVGEAGHLFNLVYTQHTVLCSPEPAAHPVTQTRGRKCRVDRSLYTCVC